MTLEFFLIGAHVVAAGARVISELHPTGARHLTSCAVERRQAWVRVTASTACTGVAGGIVYAEAVDALDSCGRAVRGAEESACGS